MRRVTITLHPGIWRDPAWIIDEIERQLERRGAQCYDEAVRRVADAHGWLATVRVDVGGELFVDLVPARSMSRTYSGISNHPAPVFVCNPHTMRT